MEEVRASFELYRRSYENSDRGQGLEAEGIFEIESFNEVINDPETPKILLPNATLPLLSSLRHSPWVNSDFYNNLGVQNRTILTYSHLSKVFANNRQTYLEAVKPRLCSLAQQGGVIIYDTSDHEASRVDTEVDDLLSSLGINYQDRIAESSIDSRHFHYASPGVREGVTESGLIIAAGSNPMSFYDAYKGASQNGFLKGYEPVEVVDSFNKADREKIWSFYDPVHAGISNVDPAYAGFNETDLDKILEDDDFIKLVYRAGRSIVNVCVVTNVQNCNWLNQYFYETNYPKEYEMNQVVCGVGLLTNPDVERQSTPSLLTMGMVGKLVDFACADVVFTFANNSISNLYVPRLTQKALGDAKLKTDFTKPVSHQVFRALELRPA